VTTTTIAELRRLEQAATPGEWWPEGSHVYGPKDSRSQYKNGRQLVATATDLPIGRQESFSPNNADAALIAAARNALPALLRVAEAAREATSLNSLCAELLVKLHGVDPTIDDEVALNGLHAEEEAAWVELRAALDALAELEAQP